MKEQIFTTISVDELQDLIQQAVKKAVYEALKIKEHNGEQQQLMSRQEAADFLKISLVTLYHWTRTNIVKSYKLSGRVYYDKTQLYDLVTHKD